MRAEPLHHEPNVWRPQVSFRATIKSLRQLRAFNDSGGIAVDIDVRPSIKPEIQIYGSQNKILSFWETRSQSGFITKPKFRAELVTLRFITSGRFVYSRRHGDFEGSPTHATLAGFEDLLEVRAIGVVNAISATVDTVTLRTASRALSGSDSHELPRLAPLADMKLPGMMALYFNVCAIQRRLSNKSQPDDLSMPLIQEMLSYQLLSIWPKQPVASLIASPTIASYRINRALEYIDGHISLPIMLSDIASAAGVSVRSLQDSFKKELGKPPVQYIIERRLERAHRDLIAGNRAVDSVSEIARRWGFMHLSDFGRRYRRTFGCRPIDTLDRAFSR